MRTAGREERYERPKSHLPPRPYECLLPGLPAQLPARIQPQGLPLRQTRPTCHESMGRIVGKTLALCIMNLRQSARGEPCMVRLPVCNFDSDTTVLAHARLTGVSGLGLKSADLLGAWACSRCHEYADTHHDTDTKLAFLQGVVRTQAELIRRNLIKW
jgi:Protein of unknown function (DUF1364)